MLSNPWKSGQDRVGLFDASLRPLLWERLIYYIRILVIFSTMYWIAGSIIYGAVYKRSDMTHHATLEVVDLDGGPVGRAVADSILQLNSRPSDKSPRWRLRTDLPTLAATREWVRLHGWGAIVINQGASQRLQDAAAGYSPQNAVTVINNTGRHPVTSISYLEPALTQAATAAVHQFALAHLAQLQAPADPLLLPTLALRPIAFTSEDVGPFSFALAPIICVFGFLVGTLMMVEALIEWKMTTFLLFRRAKHWHVWAAVAVVITAWALFVAMHSALAVSAFLGPGYTALALPYTVGRFFSLWFTTAAVLAAIGVWLFNWYLVLAPEFFGLPTLITVISNVASLMTPLELAPHFFRWFQVQPFYNGSMLFRYVLSGAYPKVGLNVGILLGEWALMVAVLFATSWIRQATILLGIADVAGWLHGGIFFHSDIPYYKDTKAALSQPARFPRRFAVADAPGDTMSLREGNLGV